MDEYATERRKMVEEQLRGRGIRDERVLDAMARIPRHEFLPAAARDQAYEDHPTPIGDDQTISQPYMVAAMTELLRLEGGESVLEIGTGSGYQTAVLAECAREVFTIERFPTLAARARTKLTSLGYENVRYLVCDGSEGWPGEAPFDRILVTAAVPAVPPAFLDQLADPGILVLPIGQRNSQELVSIRREGGLEERETHFQCAFVPMIGDKGFPG